MQEDVEIKCFALGTFNQIKIYGCENKEFIADCIVKKLQTIDDQMSAFNGDSDISKIVASAGNSYVTVHEDTLKVLERALWYYHSSDGGFDITIRPLVELWGIGKKDSFIPDRQEIEHVKRKTDASKLLTKPDSLQVKLDIPEGSADLGGIAKGFAADEVKRILLENGIENALINLGGNVVAIGRRHDGNCWKIGIQNPLAPRGEYIGILEAENKTIVTSGSNEQFFIKDKVRYHHILDPRSGYPAQSALLSVTAVCDKSIDADALTTALFVSGVEKGMGLLKKVGAEAIFITEDMEIKITDGLKGKFKITESIDKDRRDMYVC
ncbi:FAD:protein FMN transferase [Anaerobium acetethylicum]|uniref:FAD:protein FMN transferase n=1 Tax=Anaerobium acetethylicum TaxID=1619234 RepID=A0A1D3TS09_9FIRM|nr:FAD:protein FMN transferase [Anaerobium acetethylicum]SCP96567.1 thiamine biosynthesis lipoprotein [Anaerobium acetethylicum]